MIAILNESDYATTGLRRAVAAAAGIAGTDRMTVRFLRSYRARTPRFWIRKGAHYFEAWLPTRTPLDLSRLAWYLVACCRQARGVKYRDLLEHQTLAYAEPPAWIVDAKISRRTKRRRPSPIEKKRAESNRITTKVRKHERRLGRALDELLE